VAEQLPWMKDASRGAYVEHLRAIRVTDRAMAVVLRDAAADAERLIVRTLSDPANVSQTVRRAQYQQSILALREAQAELWGEVTRATQSGITRATVAASQSQAEMLNVLLRAVDENALGGPTQARFLLDSMSTAAKAATEDVRSRLVNNIQLSDQVYKSRALSDGWVERTVNRGIAGQKSAKEIAKSVRHLIRPDTPGGVSYAANRLARTEINNAFHATEIRQGMELPWVEAYQWELSGSHPRTDECDDFAELDDGLGPGVWAKGDVPAKPHPMCLCWISAVTVQPNEFNSRLLSGNYDGWLQSKGMMGIQAVA